MATIEVRAEADQAARIVGHAAVFNSLSEDLGGFREQIAPGAFAKAIGGDVRALFNHDPNWVLGRSIAKTLTMAEDARGLAVEILPPDTEQGRQVLASVRRGDVSGMSFGFTTLADEWRKQTDGSWVRTLKDLTLFDVSPVTFPAYRQTDVGVATRSLQAARAQLDVITVPHLVAARQRMALI